MDVLYLEILRIYFDNFPKAKEVCLEAGLYLQNNKTSSHLQTEVFQLTNKMDTNKCLFSTLCQHAKGRQGG